MDYRIKVLLISPAGKTRQFIADALANVEDIETVGEVAEWETVLYQVGELLPDVILMDDVVPDACGLAEEITRQFLGTSIIMLGEAPAGDGFRRMMQAGVRDFLNNPCQPAELMEAIYVAYEYSKKLQLPVAAGADQAAHKAKIITIFSNRGGVGKSTIAVNMATVMAKNFQTKTLLWDLDLYHGVVTVATGINQRGDVTDMLNEIQYLDEEQLDNYLEKHESGLKILPSPFTPEFADYVSEDHVNKILSVAKEAWDYIVVDCPSTFNETTMEALRQSDVVLLVGSLDMGTIKNLKACLMILDKLNFPRARVKLVVNRVGREFGISLSDLEKTMQMSVFATVPSDAKNVITGLNQGVPSAYSTPDTDFGRSIQLLAKSVMGANAAKQQQPVQKKGLLGRLRHKTS